MKYIILSLLAVSFLTDPMKIGKINTVKTEAKNAYNKGDYKTAAEKYKYLIDSLGVDEDEVKLNLANAYYLQKDTANATSTFQSITNSANREISSKAHQQLGVVANQQGKFEQALNDFKQAIKANPSNEEARYNYEMLKKKLEEKKKQEEKDQQQNKDQNKDQKDQQKQDQQNKDQQKKDQEKKEQEKKEQEKKDQEQKDQQQKEEQQKKEQEKKDQQNKDQKGKEEEKKDEQQEKQEQSEKKPEQAKKPDNLDREKLQGLMSEEKAKMILEAMKNQEKQYLQQQRRKPTKARDSNKPDW